MQNTEYITQPGDRWDIIAYKAYQTVAMVTADDGTIINAMALIINNNPEITVNDVLDPGLVLQIPIIKNSSSQIDSASMPPWK